MRTATAAWILTMGMVTVPFAWAAKGPTAGIVITVKGKPTLKSGGETKPIKRNQFVYEGDQVATGASEMVAIAFIGGAEVRIAENSTFDVVSGGGQRPTSVKTKAGKLWSRLLHGQAAFQVRTPIAVAAVRGTEADIDADERLTVKVYEGFVDVFNDQGRQSLSAGQMTQASAGGAPPPPRDMGSGDYESWQNALKVGGVDKQVERLRREAERERTLELETQKGQKKKIKLKLEKK